MKNYSKKIFAVTLFLLPAFISIAQQPALSFKISVPAPKEQYYHVEFSCSGMQHGSPVFKMPNWTPGYYQLMNYADKVSNFKAYSKTGDIQWEKTDATSWKIHSKKGEPFTVSYDVKATHNFVAGNIVKEDHAYLSPTGVFIYPDGMINNPVTVTIVPYPEWKKVATGLPAIKRKTNTFFAKDYDVLFDSPILMGNLDSFPSFKINNKPHYFFAYNAGNFDQATFMKNIQKIIATASGIIGDIPYNDYTFLGIGPGGGGIEHLNSTSVAFTGNGLDTNYKARMRMYSFLSHEYFHHYNVKRIRPIELGPFDYDKGSRTKMLWLSEGVTVYYEPIILSRSGILPENEMLKYFETSIQNYESKPGRQFQTPADASYHTWEEGPFGRTTDEVNKTISPYDKGPVLGILLDFKIRHETGNKRSLDDLMRLLYNKYYKSKQRGFTEEEFKKEAEAMARVPLNDFFDYIYTLKPVDYNTYLNYAGLQIDLAAKTLPGNWTGLSLRDRNDSLIVSDVEWKSPAWDAGLRRGHVILSANGEKVSAPGFKSIVDKLQKADLLKIVFTGSKGQQTGEIAINEKSIVPYSISKKANPTLLQQAIYNSWLKGK